METTTHTTLKVSLKRLKTNFWIAVGLLIFSTIIGMLGYKYFCPIGWDQAFLNASMILTGMGPIDTPPTSAGKIFSGLYALYSGVIFLSMVAIMLVPIFHVYLHKINFHDDCDEQH